MNRPPDPERVLSRLATRTAATRIAVVGASNNPEKYGHVIVRNLADKGFTVLPVNPRETQIAGLPCYPSLAAVPKPISVVSVVTPPAVTLQVLHQVAALGLDAVFLQDGSFDRAVRDYVAVAPFDTVYDACIMVVTA
jgi:hypothetical protein